MQENENKSEVARLLRQIDLEYEAAEHGLNGLAGVARHEFITARMEQIGAYHSDLQRLVGKRQAMQLLLKGREGQERAEGQIHGAS